MKNQGIHQDVFLAKNLSIFSICMMVSLLFFIACSKDYNTERQAAQNSMVRTVITGEIMDYDLVAKTNEVYLKESFFSADNPLTRAAVKADGKFKIEVYLNRSKHYNLYPFNDVEVVLDPGDSVHVNVFLTGDQPHVFSGDNADDNNQLYALIRNGYVLDNFGISNETLRLQLEDFERINENEKDTRLIKLEAYIQSRTVSERIAEIMKARIWNLYYGNITNYFVDPRSGFSKAYANEDAKAFINNYFKSRAEEINKRADLISKHSSSARFYAYLGNINYFYRMGATEIDQIPINYEQGLLDEVGFNQKINDHMNHGLALNTLLNNMTDEYRGLKKHKLSQIKDTKLKAELSYYEKEFEELYLPEKRKPISFNENMVTEGQTFVQLLLDQNPGKVIYLDFWAPWCAPCKRSMLASAPVIEEKYENRKDMVVYTICSSKSIEKCKKFVEENAIPGEHIIFTGQEAGDMLSLFGKGAFTSIPYYVIIDKNHRVTAKGTNLSLEYLSSQKIVDDLLAER